ncbi:MAG: hypothetical protein H8E66_13375 [Planctomycetes bacterium]|nr:hypothetical protein [Planctomycetota bacterium]
MQRLLRPGVMTSSSDLPVVDLVKQVQQLSCEITDFDLLLLRDADLREVYSNGNSAFTAASIIAGDDGGNEIYNWLSDTEAIGQLQLTVPALATYFPAISSYCDDDRDTAVDALKNCVTLALRLHRESPQRMPLPIVEIVAGTLLDPCMPGDKKPRQEDTIREFHVNDKLTRLCESLKFVVQEIDQSFGLALEMEPGETYILNGIDPMRKLITMIDNMDEYECLRNRVGFNLDIAHMRIANVDATDLDGNGEEPNLVPRILHAHISDHPGMHTHDQAVGTWTDIESRDCGYQPFLARLVRRAIEWKEGAHKHWQNSGIGLPFSGVVALELEGSDHIFDVHDSILRIRHIIDIAIEQHSS